MRIVVATIILMSTGLFARADEMNDMPDLACARASSPLEREQLGCPVASLSKIGNRPSESPLDRAEDE